LNYQSVKISPDVEMTKRALFKNQLLVKNVRTIELTKGVLKMKPYTQLSILTVFLASASVVLAGSLDSPADLSDPGSAMYTIEDIYNRLDTGAQAPAPSGGFTEPQSQCH